MLIKSKDQQRRVVPRWRSIGDFNSSTGMESNRNSSFPIKKMESILEQSQIAWEQLPNVLTAIEYLSNLTICNVKEVDKTEIESFLEEKSINSFSLNQTSKSLLQVQGNGNSLKNNFVIPDISIIRQKLKNSPHDPLLWLSLARLYTLNGLGKTKSKTAIRAVQTAVTLAPNDRYILRCAARFFLHIDEAEQAVWILAKSPRSITDPWLASTLVASREIAGMKHHAIKSFNSILYDDNWSHRAKAELASSLGGLAIDSGNIKLGKKMFREALIKPNENVLAQTIWTQQNRGVVLSTKPIELNNVDKTFEARALEFKQEGNWSGMFEMCNFWQIDEPYSTRPASLGSHSALIVRENIDQAIGLLKRSSVANPNDAMLINNLTFANAISGDLSEASLSLEKLSKLKYSENDSYVFNATAGLIYFRNNQVDLGRELYNSSIEYFDNNRKYDQSINCRGQLAMEEIRQGNQAEARLILEEISKISSQKKSLQLKEADALKLKLSSLIN